MPARVSCFMDTAICEAGKKREICQIICNHNNLEMINDEQQQCHQLYPNQALTVPASVNKGKKKLYCPGTFCLLFINIEFHLTSLCEAACAIANSLPESLAGNVIVLWLGLCNKPPKGGSSEWGLCPGPAAATGPLLDTWEGHQFMAFSGDFEQVWSPLKHTSTS